MRKKFEEGVTKLEEIQKIINLTPELDKFIIMFRGYSNFCLGKYKVIISYSHKIFFKGSIPRLQKIKEI